MKPPIFVRKLSKEERERLQRSGLRSKDAFTLRRSQILLASARGEEQAPRIAHSPGRSAQTRFATPSTTISTSAVRTLSGGRIFASPKEPTGPRLRREKERRGFEGVAAPLSEGVRQGH